MNITVLRQSSTVAGLQEQGTPARPKSEWRIDETLRKVFVVMGAR